MHLTDDWSIKLGPNILLSNLVKCWTKTSISLKDMGTTYKFYANELVGMSLFNSNKRITDLLNKINKKLVRSS